MIGSKNSVGMVVSAFVLLSLMTGAVLAIPGVPHAFYGSVYINGNIAPDGTVITAEVDGKVVAKTTVSDGKYGYDPIFYVDDPNNDMSGKEIKIYVDGTLAATYYFCNGCVTRLDLTITREEGGTISPESQTSTSGGAATAGAASSPPTTTTEEPNGSENENTASTTTSECVERWVCTEWSSCKDGMQTRSCEDVNNCGTDLNKPLEVQPCSIVESDNVKKDQLASLPSGSVSSAITGFTALHYSALGAGAAVVALLAGIAMWRKKRITS